MSFDRETRNKLARMVGDARRRLVADVTDTLRQLGLQDDGTLVPLSALPGLSDADKTASDALRAQLAHFAAQEAGSSEVVRAEAAHARLVREIGFTTLNRLVALRMAEERGLITESVRNGLSAAGFQLFERIANGSLGTRGETYRAYLECLYDELAVDLASLFSRTSPESLVFPSEAVLEQVLGLLNDPSLAELWKEDETIGWVYQYYNDPDERKKMRDASQAPRNSRELAVRNQFFTPRYVVEFLTDNTLGRTWYEMRQGDTRLRDDCPYLVRRPTEIFLQAGDSAPDSSDKGADLSQAELLKQPVYVPFRAKKDPRDLRILDPACGSGHFLLHAFDLLETIYEEAWSDDASPRSYATGRTLPEEYADLGELRRAIPGLILRHNLHGVDIDPRAVQIAGLALWLRAQRSYQNLGVVGSARPRLTRSNLVVAESMPGERDLLDQFVARLDPPLIGGLVKLVFTKMQLAGEAGMLLGIEHDLRDAISTAKKVWQRGPMPQQLALMPGEVRRRPEQMPLDLDTSGISDESFWDRVEERVLAALSDFAAEASSVDATRRRLFADDTVRGFAFVDMCRTGFDAVLMNPPFGEAPKAILDLIDKRYPRGRNDIYAAFVIRSMGLTNSSRGRVGVITSRSFVTGRDHRHFRRAIICGGPQAIDNFLDLGGGVLDGAVVETAAYTIGDQRNRYFAAIDSRSRDNSDTAEEVINAIRASCRIVDRSLFEALPNCDFLYQLEPGALSRLTSADTIEPSIGRVTFGLTTKDDFRFVRLRWEIDESLIEPGGRWSSFAKGGEYGWFTGETHLVVKQGSLGEAELAAFAETRDGNVASTRRSSTYYYRPAVAFSRRSQKGFSARRLRRNACFSDKSGVIFPDHPGEGWLLALPFVFASSPYQKLITAQSTFGSYEIGPIKQLPCPPESVLLQEERWREVYQLFDEIDARDETSQIFQGPPGKGWSAVKLATSALHIAKKALRTADLDLDDNVERLQLGVAAERDRALAHGPSLLSYLIGVLFGRWSPLGEVCWPETTTRLDPYDSPKSSARAHSCDRRIDGFVGPLLVDDPGHVDDLTQRLFEAATTSLPLVEHAAIDALGSISELRRWIRSEFFADHLRRYSKSHRQAPIYWPLSTQSGSYTIWLYYPSLTSDTLFTVANRYVQPKIVHVERRVREAREAHESASGREKGRLLARVEELSTFLSELSEIRDELKRITELPYRPNLEDGVIINAAPLHKLFRFPKWAKDTRDVWQKLERGDYDWAHMAYTIWPDRVREKCRTDRSLAIAHDLEHLYSGPPPGSRRKQRGRAAVVTDDDDDE